MMIISMTAIIYSPEIKYMIFHKINQINRNYFNKTLLKRRFSSESYSDWMDIWLGTIKAFI